jgi:hypothetical protein
MAASGSALGVPGNHDMKLLKNLNGRDVQITHGLAGTLAEIDALPDDVRPAFTHSLADFLDGLVSHYVLDGGRTLRIRAPHRLTPDAGTGRHGSHITIAAVQKCSVPDLFPHRNALNTSSTGLFE